MRAVVFTLVALAACDSGSVKLGGKSGSDSADTGLVSDDTGAPDDDSAADTAETADTAPPAPLPDYSVWDGARTFSYTSDWGDCTESTNEFGEELLEGDTYDQLLEACPDCEHLYEVGVSPDELCDWIGLSDPTYRGLVLGEGWAAVYGFDWDWSGDVEADLLDDDADFDGWTLSYAYELEYAVTLAVTGTVTFPELDE